MLPRSPLTPPSALLQESQLSGLDFVSFVHSLAGQSATIAAAFANQDTEGSSSSSPTTPPPTSDTPAQRPAKRACTDGAEPVKDSASHAVAAQALMDLMSPGSASLLGGQGPVTGKVASARPELGVPSPKSGGEEQQQAAAAGCYVPASPSISSASTLRCGSIGREDSGGSQSPGVEQPAAAATEPAGAALAEDGSAHNKYCHFCQHIKVKRASSMLACENRGCNRRFCEHCLQTHLGDTAAGAPAWRAANGGAPWHCPICAKTCCCTQRDCGKTHRHCKAYRYRRKRALLAESDKAPEPAVDPRPAQLLHAQARLGTQPMQAMQAMPSFASPMPFGVMGAHQLQQSGGKLLQTPYGSLAGLGGLGGLGGAIGMGAQMSGLGNNNMGNNNMGNMGNMGNNMAGMGNMGNIGGGMGGLQMGQLAQMQALLQQQVALQQQRM